MRSFLASLRVLVLPYGQTTGRRLILDGINGEILIYDAANNLVGVLNTDPQFAVKAPSSNASAGIFADASRALLFLQPPDTVGETWTEAQILGAVFGGQPYLELNSPNGTSGLYSRFQLYGSSAAFPTDTRIRLEAATSVKVVGGATFSVERSGTDRLPPLEIGITQNTTDVTGIVGGTTTDTLTVPLISGRQYDVELDMEYASTIAGDTAQVAVTDVTGSATLGHCRLTLPRAADAFTCRLVRRYTAAATANRQFGATCVRAAGTGTLSRLGAGTAGPSRLRVLEVA